MWELMIAAVGVLGGLLLGKHSALLQRRNWQLQEAMRAYSRMFVEFERFWPLYQRYVAHPKDPGSQSLMREIREGTGQGFDQALKQCWMLERSQELRREIDQITKLEQTLYVKVSFWATLEQDEATRAQGKKYTNDIIQLMNKLDNLRKGVAQFYFHPRSAESESTGTSQGAGPQG